MSNTNGSEQDRGVVDLLIMPWLAMTKEVIIGSVQFTPRKLMNGMLSDASGIKDYLNKVLNCYVDEVGQPVQTGAVCRLKDRPGFSALDGESAAKISEAVDGLCFSTLFCAACDSRSDRPYSSVRLFDLFRHSGDPASPSFAMHRSHVVAVNYTYDNFKVTRPIEIIGFGPRISGWVPEALSELCGSSKEKLRERVFRSFFARGDSGAVTEQSQIVMMATAFEILLI